MCVCKEGDHRSPEGGLPQPLLVTNVRPGLEWLWNLEMGQEVKSRLARASNQQPVVAGEAQVQRVGEFSR